MKKFIAVMLLAALCMTACLVAACNETCDHTWNDQGVCTKCGDKNPDFVCEHTWNKYGVCTKCGDENPDFECEEHEFSNGVCIYCGIKQHVHDYDELGNCKNAKETYGANEEHCSVPKDLSKCQHPSYENDKCTNCGHERNHVHTLDNHGCCTGTLASGEKCSYQDRDKCTDHSDCDLYGKCNYCGKKYSGFVCKNHSYESGKCKYCDAAEPTDLTSLLKDPITITFYSSMGQNLRDVFDQYLEEFNELYPNITVTHTQVGGYDDVRDQIKTEIAAKAGPSVAYCYPDHVASYNTAGAVAILDSYIYSNDTITIDGKEYKVGLTDEEIADFIPGYWEEGKQFGTSKMYTLPFSKSTEVLYYNKTFFDANNIPVPTHWWCSADICGNCNSSSMEAVCAKIREIDPTSTPLGYDSESNWFITMCEQLGSEYTAVRGENFRFDNETNRAFVKRFYTWRQNDWVTTQEIYGAYTSGLFTETAADKTKSYMSIGSSAGATHQRPTKGDTGYPFEVGIASIPQMDQTNPKVISQGPSLCMFSKSDKAEELAAWLFMKYFTTNAEFQADFSLASGYIPVLQSVRDESKADYYKNENGQYIDINGYVITEEELETKGVPNVYKAFQDQLGKKDGGDNISMLSLFVALEQANAYYTSPAFNGSSTARDQVGQLLQKCLTLTEDGGDIDAQIKTAFEKAVAECKALQ